jgi:N-acetylglutamate synthase-like GNAT family acetyltransferase
MIYELDNPLLINKVLDLAKNIPNTNIITLEKMLIKMLGSKKAKVYIAEKNNEPIGFIFGTLEQINGENCVFIQATYIKPDKEERYIGFEFLTKMRLFARDSDVDWLYIMTSRKPEGYIRKYHFEFCSTILRRRV